MDENKSSESDTPGSGNLTKGNLLKPIPITILIGILAIVSYFIIKKGDLWDADKMFTQYEPLHSDTLHASNNVPFLITNDELKEDSAIYRSQTDTQLTNVVYDSLMLIPKSKVIPLADTDSLLSLKPAIPDTLYKLDLKEKRSKINLKAVEQDLLSELLIEESNNDTELEVFFESKIISIKTVVELLSMAGLGILTNDNILQSQEAIKSISASEAFKSVLVINRKGAIVYSSEVTIRNALILSEISLLEKGIKKIQIKKVEDVTILAIPIYHRYGYMGQVVSIINASIESY